MQQEAVTITGTTAHVTGVGHGYPCDRGDGSEAAGDVSDFAADAPDATTVPQKNVRGGN